MFFGRGLRAFVYLSVLALLTSCGDDGSATRPSSLPSEVADMSELEDYKCDMSLIGEIVYVKNKRKNYECDGDKWFESYNQSKSSSSVKMSSSSNKKSSSSSMRSGGETYSSSSVKYSDSSVKFSSSSSKNSSSSVVSYSSTSSSSRQLSWSSSWEPTVLPPGKYDCSVYDCVSTAYLNPNVEYGEFLDERDNKVYRTVKIGELVWMAQNLNYYIDSESIFYENMCYNNDTLMCARYGRLYNQRSSEIACPEGWHLPTSEEIKYLEDFVGNDAAKLRSINGWREKKENYDSFGFSAIPAGAYKRYVSGSDVDWIFYFEGYRSYFWLYTLDTKFGYSGAYIEAYGMFQDNMSYRNDMYSVRCIQGQSPLTSPCGMKTCEYGSFTDERDGRTYKTVTIGEQIWMAENLNYAYLQPTKDLDSSSFCFNDSLEYCEKYGRLYLWSAAMDSAGLFGTNGKGCGAYVDCSEKPPVRGVCPENWHLPSNSEWEILFKATGRKSYTGAALKSVFGWDDQGNGADAYGFSALPVGDRAYDGEYYGNGSITKFWSSSEFHRTYANYVYLSNSSNEASISEYFKESAHSVRCLHD